MNAFPKGNQSKAASPFMVGVAAGIFELTPPETDLMRGAGIHWLRSGHLGFDPQAFFKGESQPARFMAVKNRISELRQAGFRVIGITPGPKEIDGLAGVPGSCPYFDNYQRICAFLGMEFAGLIDTWQVANELDIWIFRHTLSLEQSVDFLKAGVRGLKSVGADLNVGINITLFPSRPGEVDGNTDQHEGVYIAKSIYHDSGLSLDYAGFDSYPGTWRDGGAESWSEYLDEFYALTRKPILIQEFGYSSAGELMSDAEKHSDVYPCKAKKWRFSWRGGHTPEIQADFIEESFHAFSQKPYVLGAIYYRWKDSGKCWQCGQSDCPIETAWGLLDHNGNIKPSYYRLKASVSGYFGA